jgi:hypothetical protein
LYLEAKFAVKFVAPISGEMQSISANIEEYLLIMRIGICFLSMLSPITVMKYLAAFFDGKNAGYIAFNTFWMVFALGVVAKTLRSFICLIMLNFVLYFQSINCLSSEMVESNL